MPIIRIRKGLDLPLAGRPEQRIERSPPIHTAALVAADFPNLKPSLVVQAGDRVKAGQLLLSDKRTEGVHFTAPASGVVEAVNRGAKRAFQSLVIRIEEDDPRQFDVPRGEIASLSAERVRDLLLESGLWTAIRQRPYSKIPSPAATPHSLFVQAIDTNPHAPNSAVVIAEHRADFMLGLEALRRLVDRPIHLCTAPGKDIPGHDLPFISHTQFEGPHPAGLPGTHIHFLDPVSPAKSVWYIGYQDVIAIGRLFSTGQLWTERVISLAGPQVAQPRLLRTQLGGALAELTAGQLRAGENRVISGSVLSGRAAEDPTAFLGRYHTQVAVLLEGRERTFLGWQMPGFDKFSVKPAFAAALAADGRQFDLTTTTNGSKRAMVPIGSYEKVMPLDILPTFLLRAILCGDTDEAQALGALELDEEDLALCTFVDPGKHDFGPILRLNLQKIELEG